MDKLPFEEEVTGGREYIPPDYSDVITPDEDDDDDLDDDDYELDDEEDEDPAELEEELENQKRETLREHPVTQQQSNFINPQPKPTMSTPTWPTGTSTPGTPWGSGTQTTFGQWNQPAGNSMPWGQKPGSTWPSSGTTPGWGNNSTAQKETLNRSKRVIICDVLDCLVSTLDGPQKTGLIPRGIWDICNRLDVWSALRRFTNIERIYAMIPRSLILNSSGADSWAAFLNYEACALGEFLRIPTSYIQILTQRHISQSKYDMIKAITENIDKEDIVYIGLQSGHPGQNSADIDCANSLGIDYIDLQHFLVLYS